MKDLLNRVQSFINLKKNLSLKETAKGLHMQVVIQEGIQPAEKGILLRDSWPL